MKTLIFSIVTKKNLILKSLPYRMCVMRVFVRSLALHAGSQHALAQARQILKERQGCSGGGKHPVPSHQPDKEDVI